jgi:hypothetical protein
MIICPKCGNNTCNAGYGEVDGQKCDICPSAYEYQDKHWEERPKSIESFVKITFVHVKGFFYKIKFFFEWGYWSPF